MARTPISHTARVAVYNRFKDPDIGFNKLIQQANADYSLSPQIAQVDFGPTSRNLVFGQINPIMLEQTDVFRFPLICIYSHGATNKNLEKFVKFAGQVIIGVDIWWSWVKSNARQNFDDYMDAIEESVVEIVNGFGPSGKGDVTQNWGSNLVYNGGVSCSRTPLVFGADNWLQSVETRLVFNMVTD